MVDRNDSFLREVNEEIRRERLTKLWERFGTVIIVGVVLLIVGVAAYKWNEARQIAEEQRTGARFEAASRLAAERKTDEAMAAFAAIAKDGPAGYGALARVRIAGEHARAGRTADALATYEALSADSAADELLRDFAALQAAMLRLDQADWTEMKNRLTPLVGEQRAWRAQAREILGLAALKAGQSDEATKLFEQILGDRAATGGLSRRAQEMLAVLTDRAAAKSAAPGQAPAAQDAKGKNGEPAAKN
jgi:hypothetical protein